MPAVLTSLPNASLSMKQATRATWCCAGLLSGLVSKIRRAEEKPNTATTLWEFSTREFGLRLSQQGSWIRR